MYLHGVRIAATNGNILLGKNYVLAQNVIHGKIVTGMMTIKSRNSERLASLVEEYTEGPPVYAFEHNVSFVKSLMKANSFSDRK